MKSKKEKKLIEYGEFAVVLKWGPRPVFAGENADTLEFYPTENWREAYWGGEPGSVDHVIPRMKKINPAMMKAYPDAQVMFIKADIAPVPIFQRLTPEQVATMDFSKAKKINGDPYFSLFGFMGSTSGPQFHAIQFEGKTITELGEKTTEGIGRDLRYTESVFGFLQSEFCELRFTHFAEYD